LNVAKTVRLKLRGIAGELGCHAVSGELINFEIHDKARKATSRRLAQLIPALDGF